MSWSCQDLVVCTSCGMGGVTNAFLDISLLLPASSSHLVLLWQLWASTGMEQLLPILASLSSYFCASQFIASCGAWGFFWSRLETANFLGWRLSKTRCLGLLLAMLDVVLRLCLIKIPQASFPSEVKHAVMRCPSHTVTKDSITTFH